MQQRFQSIEKVPMTRSNAAFSAVYSVVPSSRSVCVGTSGWGVGLTGVV